MEKGYEEEDQYQIQTEARAPSNLKDVVACIPCLLIKEAADFDDNGCENCPFTAGRGDYTTKYFDGMVALLEDHQGQAGERASWVARYMRIENFVTGLYAIRVQGQVSSHVASTLKERGFTNLGALVSTDESAEFQIRTYDYGGNEGDDGDDDYQDDE